MIEIGLAIVLVAIALMALSLAKVSSEDEGEQDWKDKYLPDNEEENENN